MQIRLSILATSGELFDQLRGLVASAVLTAEIAESEAALFKDHLTERNALPNKRGWPKTNFYAQAAESTFPFSDDQAAYVVVAQEGFRQRYFGGTIKPVVRQFLAFPVTASAYGKKPREFTLKVQYLKKEIAPEGRAGTYLVRDGAGPNPVPYFRLVKKVTQQGDPTVIPSEQEILDVARETLEEKLAQLTHP
jgi:hypothetical protein